MNVTFKAIAVFQYVENYGAHDWNGEGECPQYWKFKGTWDELLLDGASLAMVMDPSLNDRLQSEAMGLEQHNDYVQRSFLCIDWKPSNEVEGCEEDLYMPSLEEYQNEPIDRFDKMAEGMGYLYA